MFTLHHLASKTKPLVNHSKKYIDLCQRQQNIIPTNQYNFITLKLELHNLLALLFNEKDILLLSARCALHKSKHDFVPSEKEHRN